MLKFFRKIRYNLMETGKTGKYLKYAIGEIILVVIGILIALYINNSNESRKLEKVEIDYLNRFLIDLEKDQHLWTDLIEQKNKQLQAIKRIEDIIFFNQDSIITILSLIPNALDWNDLNPHRTTFNEMLSSGNLNLIRSDSIKIKLLELDDAYNSEINRVNTFKLEHTNTMEAFRANVSFKNISLLLKNAESLKPVNAEPINLEIIKDLKSMANDKKFINNLVGLRYNYTNQLKTINGLKNQSENLIKLIQTEINLRNKK